MAKRDYYQVLGVSQSASLEEIKAAYRRRAKECHPDVAKGDPNAEETFKACTEAYEVLSEPQRRQLYDAYGHAGLESSGYRGFAHVTIDDLFENFPFADLLNGIFGFGGFGTGRTRRPRGPQMTRGADLRYDLTLTLEEAGEGKEVEIEVHCNVPCQECGTTGSKGGDPEGGYVPCPNCGGSGMVARSRGFLSIASECRNCAGAGYVLKDPCPHCNGEGRLLSRRTLKMDIPPGVDDGSRLRLSGEGEVGKLGGPAGDLYVFIHLQEHDLFRLVGTDLHYDLEVSFPQAVLGDRLSVPTLNGEAKLDLPAGVQNQEVMRIKGEGFPHLRRKGRGDLLVHVNVVTPKKVKKEEKGLYKRLRDLEKEKE